KFIESRLLEHNSNDIPLVLFPTAMILSFDSNNGDMGSDIAFKNDTVQSYFEIPEGSTTKMLIVDGQHRFVGVQRFYEKHFDYEPDIEFIVTFLVGYDLYEQAKIFANVNFEQKPVKKDLYYDIFGSLPDVKNELTLTHFTVKKLNDDQDSPLNDMVKTLGIGQGIISQAYLFKEIMFLFKPNKIFGVYFSRYKEGKDDYKRIPVLLKIYFDIVRKKFTLYWPVRNENNHKYEQRDYKSILLKTTGLGALIRIFDYLINDSLQLSDEEIIKNIDRHLSLIDEKEAHRLFSNEGDYGRSGGLQNKLYNEIKGMIEKKINKV
ncbi:MAG: DGQHR domain-containing protein, partial [Bacteroidales bacterium]